MSGQMISSLCKCTQNACVSAAGVSSHSNVVRFSIGCITYFIAAQLELVSLHGLPFLTCSIDINAKISLKIKADAAGITLALRFVDFGCWVQERSALRTVL